MKSKCGRFIGLDADAAELVAKLTAEIAELKAENQLFADADVQNLIEITELKDKLEISNDVSQAWRDKFYEGKKKIARSEADILRQLVFDMGKPEDSGSDMKTIVTALTIKGIEKYADELERKSR